MKFLRRAEAQTWITVFSGCIAFAAIVALCFFKLMDRDFYWHITAGRMIVESWSLPSIDPFAYTRAGLAYTSTHEWLAQTILYGASRIGGVGGVIALRTLLVMATLAMIASVAGFRRLSLSSPFIVLACATGLGAFLERPQLFTFVCFALTLRYALAWLDSNDRTQRRRILVWWAVTAVAWVNLHGGAALLGGVIAAAMVISSLPLLLRRNAEGRQRFAEVSCLGLLLIVALFASPSGVGNLSYVWLLLTDRTTLFISEWLPREAAEYWFDQWWWWMSVPIALLIGKRRIIFSGLLFAVFAFLSLQALRHEVLFVLASLFILTVQLSSQRMDERIDHWKKHTPNTLTAFTLLFLLISCVWAKNAYFRLSQRDNLFGYGAFTPAQGAADYIVNNAVTGNMFNTYGVGGYLISRGLPVFIDGRNVDYGFEHMGMTNVAGKDPAAFAELDRRYNFAYAIVDYDAAKEPGLVSYSVHLDRNPAWVLVYLDDWAAVYLKRTSAHSALIARDAYTILSPTTLEIPEHRTRALNEQSEAFEQELLRASGADDESVKALNQLASILVAKNKCADAKPFLKKSQERQTHRPEPFVLLASCAMQEGDRAEAAALFDRALPLLGDAYPDFNYRYVADVYATAGRPFKAWLMRAYAGDWSSLLTLFGSDDEKLPMVNPGAEAMSRFDKAMTLIESGKLKEAEEELLYALMLNPSHAEAWNNLGALRIDLKRYSEAKEALERALENRKDYADAQLNMSLALHYLGDAVGAKKHFEKARTLGADVDALHTLFYE